MQKGITVRHEEDVVNLFLGIAVMNGTNGADVLRSYIEKYIEEHRADAAKKLGSKKCPGQDTPKPAKVL